MEEFLCENIQLLHFNVMTKVVNLWDVTSLFYFHVWRMTMIRKKNITAWNFSNSGTVWNIMLGFTYPIISALILTCYFKVKNWKVIIYVTVVWALYSHLSDFVLEILSVFKPFSSLLSPHVISFQPALDIKIDWI